MKKWIYVGGAIVIIVVVLLVVGISNLGPIVKRAVNTYGPKITQTAVHLEDVSVSILSGEAKLKEFVLGNPRGFKAPSAMSVGSVYVNVDEGSLTGDTIVIDNIEVVRPEITYEKIRGTDNFQAILNNVNRAVGSSKSSEKKSRTEGNGKKLVIEDFIVKQGKVNLTVSMLGEQSVVATLPDIHLQGIGKKAGGVSPEEAFKQIFAVLYREITSPAVTNALNEQLKALGGRAQALGEEAATKALGKAGEDVKKELGGVSEKMKGLLGN
jgi:uncharacterized protein involved in outer membrane biogenesis